MRLIRAALGLALVALTACAPAAAAPTQTLTPIPPSPSPAATLTPPPSATLTVAATASATATTGPTDTPSPVPPTATPTEVPFVMPGGRLLFSVEPIEQELTPWYELDYLVFSLLDGTLEPYAPLNDLRPGFYAHLVTLSPDATRLAFHRAVPADVRSYGALYSLDLGRAEPVQLAAPAGNVRYVKWPLDGQRIAFGGALGANDEWVSIYDTVTGSLSQIAVPDVGHVENFEFSPQGDHLAFICQPCAEPPDTLDDAIYLLDLQTGELQLVATGFFVGLVWHPDGSKFYYSQEDATVASWRLRPFAYDLATGAVTPMLDPLLTGFPELISPDGQWLTYRGAGRDHNGNFTDGMFALPLNGGEAVNLCVGNCTDLRWSPDSQYAASIVYVGQTSTVYVSDLLGHAPVEVSGLEQYRVIDFVGWLP